MELHPGIVGEFYETREPSRRSKGDSMKRANRPIVPKAIL